MLISAVDQLMCIDEGDNYASTMMIIFPAGAGNAQYYKEEGGVIVNVSPHFTAQAPLIFVPQVFSALEGDYKSPDSGSVCTFRLNNLTSDEAKIAEGTLEAFRNHTALVNGTRTWATLPDSTVQQYQDVFYPTTYPINPSSPNPVEVPALAIIGDLVYGTRNDITIYGTFVADGASVSSKGDVEIRSMAADNFKVVISATSSAGGNDQVINSASETITLTATLLKNGTLTGISGATYRWYKLGESAVTLGTQSTLTVTEGMVHGVAEFVCEVTYLSTTYSESIAINDIQDQYMIDKGRHVYTDSSKTTEAQNSNVIKSSYFVEYTPTIVDKNTCGAWSGIGTWQWTFIQTGNDGVAISTKTVTPPTAVVDSVTGATVKLHGGVNVKISALNSSI